MNLIFKIQVLVEKSSNILKKELFKKISFVSFLPIRLIASLVILILPSTMIAISPTWTGTTSTTWSTNTNWTSPATAPGTSPSPFDSAIFSGTATRLTAANTGTIILNTLQFNAGAAAYSITNSGAGNFTLSGSGIVNNSSNTQTITNSSALTFSNGSDAGSNIIITNNTGGTIAFQGTSTAGNATIINSGTGNLNISGLSASSIAIGSLSGSGAIALGSKELQVNALNTSTTISGVISGTGGLLTKVGTGTLTLTGTNSYTGITTISAGTLQLGAGGGTGSVAGNITDNAALIFNRSSGLVYTGSISGSGTMTKLGSGTLTLTGTNTYTGGTTISAGILQMGNGGTTGSIVGNILDNTIFIFNRSDNFTYANIISGSGAMIQLGAGATILTGENTYTGGTSIFNGILSIGNGGITGSIIGNIADDSALVFDRSDVVTYAGVISGNGILVQFGTGTLILTGNNTYSAGTGILNGTLQIGNGGTTGSIIGNIEDDTALVFDRSDSLTYSSSISGTGTLAQQGAGTLTLNGVNTYSGNTNINSGTLILGDASHSNATIAGNININPGGTLSGFGTAKANVVNNGTISPGPSIGTITIQQNYTQGAGGSYAAQVNASGNSDLINVGGTAKLNGNLSVSAINGGFVPFYNYTIIIANAGVIGQFSNTSLDGVFTQGFLTGRVLYLPNEVQFSIYFNPILFFQEAQTPNQRAVANYILLTGGTAAIRGLFGRITNGQQFRLTLDQISGATFANQILELSHIAYGSGFEDELADHFSEFPNCENNKYVILKGLHGNKYENCNQNRSIWVIAQGGKSQLTGEDVSGLNTSNEGLSLGLEIPIKRTGAIGTAFGFNKIKSTATLPEISTDNSSLFQLGLYGRYQIKRWLLGGAIDAGATNAINTTRTIELANTNITSNSHGYLYSEQIRVSYDLLRRILRPFIGFFNQNVIRPGFTEQGQSGFELSLERTNYHSSRSQVGVMLDISTSFIIRPFASASWEHEFAQRSVQFNAQLAAIDGGSFFSIQGAETGRNMAVVKAGLILLQYKGWDMSALYEGQFASSWQDNGARLQMDFHF